jgi:hypothetical protein
MNTLDWLIRNGVKFPGPWTDDHKRCLDVLAAALGQVYNWPTPTGLTAPSVNIQGQVVSVLVNNEIATFDGDTMTRLVLAAHKHHVRVAVSGWRPRWDDEFDRSVVDLMRASVEYEPQPDPWVSCEDFPPEVYGVMEIMVTPRTPPPGRLFARHPGIPELVSRAFKVASS